MKNKPTFSTMTISYYLVIFLLLLTPALLIWQYFGMTRIIEISPRQPHGVTLRDDTERDGNSISSLERSKDAFIMRCKPGPNRMYPYCKLQFFFGSATKGMDLSSF